MIRLVICLLYYELSCLSIILHISSKISVMNIETDTGIDLKKTDIRTASEVEEQEMLSDSVKL